MLYISTQNDIPEIDDLYNRVSDLMEERGVRISPRIFDERKKADSDREILLNVIKDNYRISNPNSVKQWQEFLNDNYCDDEVVSAELYNDKKDNWSTDGKRLAKLIHADADKYRFAMDLIAYRRTKKYSETIESLLQFCNKSGIVKPKVSLGKTNRINYKDPALMNIPKKMLWKLVAPYTDGNILFSIDIKNQEPWILINMLNIQELRDIINKNPAGLYNGIFEKVYGGEPTEIQRKEVKTAWNAMTYGASKFGILNMCMNIDGNEIYKYFNHIKELKEYVGKCYAMANRKQRIVETLFGTQITADGATTSIIRRQLMDLPIQGTGADILALLIENFDNTTKGKGLTDKVMLYYTRHDEVIIEVDRQFYDEKGEEFVVSLLKNIFEHQIDEWEPFKVEINRVDLLVDESKVFEEDEEDE